MPPRKGSPAELLLKKVHEKSLGERDLRAKKDLFHRSAT